MARGPRIRCFDYVNRSYAQVRDALKADALMVFSRATQGAASRVNHVAAQLHVHIGVLEVGTNIEIVLGRIQELPGGVKTPPCTRLELDWKALESAHLFPTMHAELSIYPLTGTETQLDFSGDYELPLGILGSAVNAIIGQRIAEASVHRFVTEVAGHLRSTLT